VDRILEEPRSIKEPSMRLENGTMNAPAKETAHHQRRVITCLESYRRTLAITLFLGLKGSNRK